MCLGGLRIRFGELFLLLPTPHFLGDLRIYHPLVEILMGDVATSTFVRADISTHTGTLKFGRRKKDRVLIVTGMVVRIFCRLLDLMVS